jgi:hypothetical protein
VVLLIDADGVVEDGNKGRLRTIETNRLHHVSALLAVGIEGNAVDRPRDRSFWLIFPWRNRGAECFSGAKAFIHKIVELRALLQARKFFNIGTLTLNFILTSAVDS